MLQCLTVWSKHESHFESHGDCNAVCLHVFAISGQTLSKSRRPFAGFEMEAKKHSIGSAHIFSFDTPTPQVALSACCEGDEGQFSASG